MAAEQPLAPPATEAKKIVADTPPVCILVHILATHLAAISDLLILLAKFTRKHNSILELRTEWG